MASRGYNRYNPLELRGSDERNPYRKEFPMSRRKKHFRPQPPATQQQAPPAPPKPDPPRLAPPRPAQQFTVAVNHDLLIRVRDVVFATLAVLFWSGVAALIASAVW